MDLTCLAIVLCDRLTESPDRLFHLSGVRHLLECDAFPHRRTVYLYADIFGPPGHYELQIHVTSPAGGVLLSTTYPVEIDLGGQVAVYAGTELRFTVPGDYYFNITSAEGQLARQRLRVRKCPERQNDGAERQPPGA